MSRIAQAAGRPPIKMIDNEAEQLANLAIGVEHRLPQVADLLLQEIERAEIFSPEVLPADVISMMSVVEFLDEGSGAKRTVQLVYPQMADIAEGRISILTPVGAGLIGLSVAQSILWPDRDGRERKLTIVNVSRAREMSDPV